MIKKFIDRLLGKATGAHGGKTALGKRVELAKAEHGIDRSLLDANAVKVVQTLKDAGYEAYIVGGAVRDLLLGLAPEGLRRRHQRHAGAGQGAVPARLHHRAALSHRPRGLRPRTRARGDRGLDLPRHAGVGRRRAGQRQREDLARRTGRQEPRRRYRRSRAARQRLGSADRGRGAARFHRQRDVLRPAGRGRRRLPRRSEGRPKAPAAHDRRPGDALPRRSGAHHPRRALRGQARLRDRAEDARADRRDGRTARERAAVAPVRRDAQAAADRARAAQHRGTAKAGSDRQAPGRVPDPRRRAGRPEARGPRPLRATGAGRHRPARRRGQAGGAELPARLPALARRAGRLAKAQGPRRGAIPGAAAGHRRGVRRPHRRHLRPRQARRRHARDLVDAAALRAPLGQRALLARRAAALSRRLRLPAPACRRRRDRVRARRVVGGLLARLRRGAERAGRTRPRAAGRFPSRGAAKPVAATSDVAAEAPQAADEGLAPVRRKRRRRRKPSAAGGGDEAPIATGE